MLFAPPVLMLALVAGEGETDAPPSPVAVPQVEARELWKEIRAALGLYGDIRLRYEGNFEQDSAPDRNRGRARVRLGGASDVTEQFRVGVRVTTGNPDDPNSPHVDFGDVLDSDSISFDRYFVTYSPDWCEGLKITGGKFGHGFTRSPVYGELVWDADVQPEGVAASYALGEVLGLDALDLDLGEYVLLEQSLADEASLFVAQATARKALGEDTSGTLALGWYRYANTTPDGNFALIGDNAGNAVVDTDADTIPDEFVSDFSILNPILGVTFDGWSQPVTLGAEYMHNLDANISADSGHALGVAVGRAREPGEWKAYYQYAHLEQDSVFSAFAQDDFLLATNTTNHVAGVQYRIDDGIVLHLWGLVSARDELSPAIATADSGSNQWRVRLDLNVTL